MGSPDTEVCSNCAVGKHKKCDQKKIPGATCDCLQCKNEDKDLAEAKNEAAALQKWQTKSEKRNSLVEGPPIMEEPLEKKARRKR